METIIPVKRLKWTTCLKLECGINWWIQLLIKKRRGGLYDQLCDWLVLADRIVFAFSADGKLSVTLVLALMQVFNERSEKKNSNAPSGGVVPHCPPGEVMRQGGKWKKEKWGWIWKMSVRQPISYRREFISICSLFLSSDTVNWNGCSSSPHKFHAM